MPNSEKLKIALTAPSLRELGGQSIQADRLIKAFENDENIELFLIPNNPKLENFSFLQNIPLVRTIFTSLEYWGLLLKHGRKADIIQVASSGETGYIVASLPPLIFAKIFGKKTLLNYHHGGLAEHIENWKLTAKPTMKMFDKIVVPSRFLVEVFADYGLSATAVFNFVETDNFYFRERKTIQPIFLSNRNFEAYYNVGDVLRAFQIIQKEVSQARLIVAGYGSEEKKLKDLARTLGLKNVEFIGKITQQEMPDVYNKADIYLNASLVDNMPLSFIEAFSSGLPIISYETGGIPYIVENEKTGLLVKIGNYQALAQKSLELLKNPRLAENLANAGKKEAEKYSREKVKKDWKSFYENERFV